MGQIPRSTESLLVYLSAVTELYKCPFTIRGVYLQQYTFPFSTPHDAIDLLGWSGRMREISLFVAFFSFFPSFFLSLVSSSRVQVVAVDRIRRSTHENVRFRARKCLLGFWIVKTSTNVLWTRKGVRNSCNSWLHANFLFVFARWRHY